MPSFLKKNKNIVILAALLFIQLVLISLQVPLGDDPNLFEKAIFAVFSPVHHGVASFFHFIGNVWTNYFDLHDVKHENEELKEELFILIQENLLLKNVLIKYQNEQTISDLLEKIHESILNARIIGHDLSARHRSIYINKGSLDGIKTDMVVLDRNGYLVGRIVNPISFREARVQLITDERSGIGIIVKDKDTIGVVTGSGENKCQLNYILDSDSLVGIGDQLLTFGKDRIYPPGILVGIVESVESTATLFKDIKVKPYVHFSTLARVAVLRLDPLEIF